MRLAGPGEQDLTWVYQTASLGFSDCTVVHLPGSEGSDVQGSSRSRQHQVPRYHRGYHSYLQDMEEKAFWRRLARLLW